MTGAYVVDVLYSDSLCSAQSINSKIRLIGDWCIKKTWYKLLVVFDEIIW